MNSFITNKRGFQLLACILAIWSWSATQSIGQINSFPYFYDFENETTGSTASNPSYTMVQTGWLNAAGDDMDWTNDVNATGSGSTGPNEDHTVAPGTFYMYLETSGTGTGRVANLETPTFDFTSAPAPQVSFWYHMYGATTGTLRFEVSTNGGTTWTSLFSLSGQQQTASADPWRRAVINTAPYGGMASVKFRFVGITGTSFTGDIGLDDFLVENILPDNAGISAMVSPVLGSAAGSYAVDVTLENYGGNTLNAVDIEWEINGVAQTAVSYAGTPLAPFTNTNVNLSASTAFPTGLTSLKFWTSMPNGIADSDVGNDTLEAFFCTGLVGTYTVGTPTSDFPTINAAEAALNGCGMAGPVTMQVQAGTYAPLIVASTIPGLSATNTLTWDGSSQTAVIQANGGINVLLDGADYITIQNFTLSNTGNTADFGVLITDDANFNVIRGNRVLISSINFSSAGIAISGSTTSATSSGINGNNTLIENNTVIGGYRGISMYGNSTVTNYGNSNVIRNNDVSAYYYGIYTYYQDGMTVDGNYVHDMTNTFNYGTYIYYTMNSAITANRVSANNYGMYFFDVNSRVVPTSDVIIANNMVIGEVTYGMYLSSVDDTKVFHNTIRGNGTATGFTMTGIENTVEIKNNIFYAEDDYAFQSFSSVAVLDMDYNIFYSGSTTFDLISYGGVYTDLVDWQTNGGFGYDQNSIEGLPGFASPTDLHSDGVLANNVGVLTSITVDIDGDVRPVPGAPTVDIGADEFTPPDNDAGVVDLLSPTIPINAGFSSVEIQVQNFGVQVLTSFMVEWEIDGVAQAPVPYTGSTIPVLGTTDMILANLNFPVNTTSLKFWTTMPNGVADERTDNDTLEINVCPGLQGVYTVGNATSDFPTVNDMMESLMACGVSGPTEMQFQIGTYDAIEMVTVPGVSSVNTLTLNGINTADATIQGPMVGSLSTAAVTLDGADYITIKNFTIINTGGAPAYGVLLTNAADHNTILDNTIIVDYSTNITNVIGILASNSRTSNTAEGNNANYTTIEGNDITGGMTSIRLEGGLSNQENIGNAILNNELHNADDYGIYVDEQDSFRCNGNRVFDLQATASDAIALYDVHNFEVMSNNVTSKDYGIYIDGGFSATDRARNGKIVNNMVIGTGTASEAMYLSDVDQLQIYHNTLVGAPAMYVNNHSNLDVRNNILSTNNDFCFETPSPTSMAFMDYNLYYISGTSGDAVRFGTTTYPTLADWQTTGPAGYDANSVAGNPNFVNGLHIASALPIDAGTAALQTTVNEDFDGQTRPMGTAPDIGADETVIIANDAMAVGLTAPMGCGSTSDDVIVSVANVGTNVLIGTPIIVNVTGATTTTFNFNAPVIIAGRSFDFNVGTLNTSTGGVYNFEIIIASGSDTNPSNDTANVSVTITPNNENAFTNVGDTIVCAGQFADLDVLSTVPGISILWYDSLTGGNLLTVGRKYTTTMPITASTTYYVQLQGCDSPRKAITVDADNVGIDVELGAATATICSNGALELIPTVTGSAAVSTTWSNGALSSLIEVTNSGQYIVMVESASGCMDQDTVNVQALATPIISRTAVSPDCGGDNDGSIDLSVGGTAGPYTYGWSNGASTQDLNGLSGGVYVVTITEGNGGLSCSYVESVQLTEPTTLTTNVDLTSTSCNGNDGTVQLTTNGGAAGYSYSWSHGVTTEDLTGLTGGVYDVTVTDANGCTATNSVNVATTNPIVATIDTVFNEIEDVKGAIELNVTGGSGNLQYSWSTGANTQNLDSLVAGTYSVTIVDNTTGCQTIISNIVVAYQIPDMVNDIQSLSSLKVYPNPTSGLVSINMVLNESADVQLEIMSVTGQRLQSFATVQGLEQNYEVDMSNYPAGVYMARIIVGNQVTTTKIIVSRN